MPTSILAYKNECPLLTSNKDLQSSKQNCFPETLAREPSSITKLQIGDFHTQNLFLQQIFSLKNMIPKQIMTLEEKYLRHCLELIQLTAMGANLNLLPDRFTSTVVGGDALFLFSSGDGNLVISGSSVEDTIVGSITGSTSMRNLLNSPLLHPSGFFSDDDDDDDDIKYAKLSAIEVSESSCVGSSQDDMHKKRVVAEDQIFGCDTMHKRPVSFSSTNSMFSDPSSSSSSSSSSAYRQGMLHCSWNNGFPRYVLSVEDQKEVYATNFSKVESDYIYTFYSKAGKRENEIHDEESDIVGRMRVSTSLVVCPLDTDIMETQFILCGTDHHSEGRTHTINQTVKKSKGLSKKVSNIFRGNHSRQNTSSIFDGSVAIQDNLLESSEEGSLFPESSSPSKLELAFIVVKDHIPKTQKKVEVGGWGLKFLKEGEHKQKIVSPVTQSVHCEPCAKNMSSHSSSMDIVVPAGIHGGPRTKSGGPSSLVERWRSGGACDCGGWDLGCPLTVLNAGPNNKDVVYKDGVFGKSNSFELFTQGCKQSLPVLEVINVRDGLYYIHYQSTLSSLQSLSIAVAIIHSHSPTLKPKVYRS